MKKIWMHMCLLSVSLACTLQVEAGFMDMGGFQIQVEQKEDTEIGPQTEEDDREKLEKASPAPEGTDLAAEEQTTRQEKDAQQAEIPGSRSEEGQTSVEEEEPVQEQEAEGIWTAFQQDTGTAEEDIVPVPEWIQEGAGILQEEGQEDIKAETIKPVREEQKVQETVGSGQEETEEEQRRVQRRSRGRGKTEVIRFAHEDCTRIVGKGSLAVRLEGEQEVCILSCAVDHKECAYRWEHGCLVPVDTPVQKGLNCLEVSVLLPDGQIVAMEPWYFSCGVGLAVL